MNEHWDAVVVGSGFGGSVAAYRLAQADRRVMVLERGRAYPPGSFPRSPAQMGRAFWDPAEGLYGMFDVWSFRGCSSVVSSGLGGGSLIYANVLLRKDEHWFVKHQPLPDGGYESWPVTRTDLDPYYDSVERMLGANPYPLEHPAYTDTAKTRAMQDAAAALGLAWQLPPLSVKFAPAHGGEPGLSLPIVDPEYGSMHGVTRKTCRLCGECNIGCNDGAKNSLDHTYLAAARHHGAELRTWHDVRAIRPRAGGGFEVDYVRHDPESEGRPPDVQTATCDRLVLAAGTYGTSYLLLRSKAEFPGLSPALGTRFSGNGDLLTFMLRATDRSRTRAINASHGPVVTIAIRLADELDGVNGNSRGAYIQDGGYPGFVDWLVEGANVRHELGRLATFVVDRIRALVTHDTNLSAEIADLLGDGVLSGSSLPLLGMGRDVPDGVLRLRDGRLHVDWNMETSKPVFDRMRVTMRRIADVLGADYADNPLFRTRIITVHPLGGAPMGRHSDEGVCDAYGEVFGYPGLYIADGAALPGSVGANPALTIAALADRMSTRLLEGRSLTDPTRGTRGVGSDATCGPGDRTSLSFTEEMRGFAALGQRDPDSGEIAGRQSGDRLAFRLTITIDDMKRFLEEPAHPARAEGWIDADCYGGRRQVERGWFNLFAPGDAPNDRDMRYRLHFSDGEGQPRTLLGWKNVHHGPPTRLWLDTSTLFVTLHEGHVDVDPGDDEDAAPVAGAGRLHIRPTDLAQTLTTFRTTGPEGAAALARFGRFFLGQLWEVYGPS